MRKNHCRFVCLVLFLVCLVDQSPAEPQKEIAGMSLIPAGEFWRGQSHIWIRDALEWTERARLDAWPSRPIFVDAFYLDKNEVTNDDFARFTTASGHANPWHWKDGQIPAGQGKMPVYNVSWQTAVAYCNWASKRLPTEAEWEKAARGGLDRKLYPWGDEFGPKKGGRFGDGRVDSGPKMAHYGFPNGPAAVGSYPANGYGLYDMIGNVWEWTADWYERNYYIEAPAKNPKGPETGMYRVIRGGGWNDEEPTPSKSIMSNHYRNYNDPEAESTTLGFRCAKSPVD